MDDDIYDELFDAYITERPTSKDSNKSQRIWAKQELQRRHK